MEKNLMPFILGVIFALLAGLIIVFCYNLYVTIKTDQEILIVQHCEEGTIDVTGEDISGEICSIMVKNSLKYTAICGMLLIIVILIIKKIKRRSKI